MSLRMWRKPGPILSVEGKKGFFDVAYGTVSEKQKMDIYLPEGPGPFPVIISIHGGGFVACDKRQDDMITPMLAGLEKGYAVVSLNYRLLDEAYFPEPVKDVKQAIRYLRRNAQRYSLDAENFVTWGGSAGGYLTLMSCLFENETLFDNQNDPNLQISAAIKGGIAWYPCSNLATLEEELKINSLINRDLRKGITDVSNEYEPMFPHCEENQFPFYDVENSFSDMLLGGKADEDSIRKGSPFHYIKESMPAIFMQHGSADEIVPMQQSIKFAIKANDMLGYEKVKLEIIGDAIHSSLLFETKENLDKIFKFIDELFVK